MLKLRFIRISILESLQGMYVLSFVELRYFIFFRIHAQCYVCKSPVDNNQIHSLATSSYRARRVQESRWNFVTFLGRPTNFGQPGIAGRRIRSDEAAGVVRREIRDIRTSVCRTNDPVVLCIYESDAVDPIHMTGHSTLRSCFM